VLYGQDAEDEIGYRPTGLTDDRRDDTTRSRVGALVPAT